MSPVPASAAAAFRRLSVRLRARRIAALEPAVRVLLVVFALVLLAFTFWQVRIPLAGAAQAGGPPRAAGLLAIPLAALALAAGAGTFNSARRMVAHPPGPEWLALPAPPTLLARHLLAEARLPALAAVPPALAVIVAGIQLLPPSWLALAAVAFVVAWLECTRLAHAVAWRLAVRPPGATTRLGVVTRALAGGLGGAARARSRAARWTARSSGAAILALDLARTSADSLVRRAALSAVGVALASLAAWALPRPGLERAALAFAGQMLAAGAAGAWSSALVGGDPANLWRPLPLAPRRVWAARVRPLALGALGLSIAHAACAATLGAPAAIGIAFTWPIPTLLVATLGLHHALSLYPDAAAATRITTTWLAVAIAASIMIPLLGWVVLLAAAIHAARRVVRGFHSETR